MALEPRRRHWDRLRTSSITKGVRVGLLSFFVATGVVIGTAATSTVAAAAQTDWSAPLYVDPTHALHGVSCANPLSCVAVDNDGDEVAYNGSTFSSPKVIDEASIDSVSCPTTTFCVAVDDQGGALTFNGASWVGPSPIDSSVPLSVSCSSIDFCVEVD